VGRRIGARLGGALLTLFVASVAVFLILRLIPADPARLIVGPLASAAAIQKENAVLGLTKPIYTQYFIYIGGFIRGQWGFDYGTGSPVIKEVIVRLPASLELGFYAMIFAILGAVGAALASVGVRTRAADAVLRGVAFVGQGSPPFWIGLMALVLFAEILHVLPGPVGRLSAGVIPPPTVTHFYTFDAIIAGQWGTLGSAVEHLILPAITLGLAPFGYLFRLLRQSLLAVSEEEFLLVCEGKGLTRWQALVRHGLPNSLLPALTAAGLLVAQLVAGSVLVESVFNWPGVGQLVVNSVAAQEYGVVQAFVILSACAFVVVNLVVDTLYTAIDPRLRRPGVME
jgi:ABC-type dipeptide/oligopeptide/nickel transport system permease component